MRTSFLGKVHFVASKYDPETRAKAVRLVLEHRDDYPSEWAAITAVSKRFAVPLVLGEPTRHEVGDELVEMTLVEFLQGKVTVSVAQRR